MPRDDWVSGVTAADVPRQFMCSLNRARTRGLPGFGLSTQIPARTIYISTGPSRVYKVGKHTIEFQHRCSRETDILGRNARMVVRALKGLGKDYATKEIVANMASRYSDEEWRQICEASKRVSS